MNPTVSVLLTVYNNVADLPRALQGLRQQSLSDFEVIAVDDGSTDGSGELLERTASEDGRFRVIRQANTGLVGALQRAVHEARGRLFARQDADDLSGPERLARQVAYLDARPSLTGCGTWSLLVHPEDHHVEAQTMPDHPARLGRLLAQGWNPFVHGSMMFRSEAYRRVPGYRLRPCSQDYDLWLQLATEGQLGLLPSLEYAFWFHPGGISYGHQHVRPAAEALARQLHRERRRNGRELTDVAGAIEALQSQFRPATTGERRASALYAEAVAVLRRGEYRRYRALLAQAAGEEGRWADRARQMEPLARLAPLLRRWYAWRLRGTPMGQVHSVPPEALPDWLRPWLLTPTLKPAAP
jgi:glycosyltransferase involved in cell wall biosynthesis